MFYCPNCRNEIDGDYKRCPYCGYKFFGKKKSHAGLIIALIIGFIVIAFGLGAVKVFYDDMAKEEYLDDVRNCGLKMANGLDQATDTVNIMLNVWHNSIYNVSDPDTDRYTHDEDGEFYDDFNDAMGELYQDESFQRRMNLITDNRSDVISRVGKLKNPPKGCENTYSLLMDLYDSYEDYVNNVISPSGNYETYMTKLKEAEESATKAANRLVMDLQ